MLDDVTLVNQQTVKTGFPTMATQAQECRSGSAFISLNQSARGISLYSFSKSAVHFSTGTGMEDGCN